jgi:hypothetical protein
VKAITLSFISRRPCYLTATVDQDEIELNPISRVTEIAMQNLHSGGYSSLSSFMSSDKVFSIFRRFDELSTRNLLFLQDELGELESRLAELDKADLESGNETRLISLHSRRFDGNQGRKDIMKEVRVKIGEYRQ